jgi:hypothetical protein
MLRGGKDAVLGKTASDASSQLEVLHCAQKITDIGQFRASRNLRRSNHPPAVSGFASCMRVDNPPQVWAEGYLQRCLSKKDTAALNENRQLRAVDATDCTKQITKLASVPQTSADCNYTDDESGLSTRTGSLTMTLLICTREHRGNGKRIITIMAIIYESQRP